MTIKKQYAIERTMAWKKVEVFYDLETLKNYDTMTYFMASYNYAINNFYDNYATFRLWFKNIFKKNVK